MNQIVFRKREFIALSERIHFGTVQMDLIVQLLDQIPNQEFIIEDFIYILEQGKKFLYDKTSLAQRLLKDCQDELADFNSFQIALQSLPQKGYMNYINLENFGVVNIKVHNQFVINEFRLHIKLNDMLQFTSPMQPSYNLNFPIRRNIEFHSLSDQISFELEPRTPVHLLVEKIEYPLYQLKLSDYQQKETFIIENEDTSIEFELAYSFKVENVQGLLRQTQVDYQGLIERSQVLQEDIHEWQEQLRQLLQINPRSIIGEKTSRYHQQNSEVVSEIQAKPSNQDFGDSNRNYSIQIPSYYKLPLTRMRRTGQSPTHTLDNISKKPSQQRITPSDIIEDEIFLNQEILSGLAIVILSISSNFYNEMINLTLFIYILMVHITKIYRRPLIVLVLCASFIVDFLQIEISQLFIFGIILKLLIVLIKSLCLYLNVRHQPEIDNNILATIESRKISMKTSYKLSMK